MRSIAITRQLGAADADGISLAQSLAAAGNLTITGAFASGGIATLDQQRKVAIASTLNLSAITFTVTGTNFNGIPITESLLGPNAGTVSTVQDFLTVTQIAVSAAIGVSATGVLTLTGNAVAAETVTIGTQVYTWVSPIGGADTVLVGATASDSLDNLIAAINNAAGEGVTYGTGTAKNVDATAAAGAGDTMDLTAIALGAAGNAVVTTETMTVGSFGAGTLTGGVDGGTVGTSGVGASQVIPLDQYISPFNVSLGIDVTGTIDVTLQFTFDDIFANQGPFNWTDHPDLTNVVADGDGTFISPVSACRLLTNSGTGTAILRVLQAGLT